MYYIIWSYKHQGKYKISNNISFFCCLVKPVFLSLNSDTSAEITIGVTEGCIP